MSPRVPAAALAVALAVTAALTVAARPARAGDPDRVWKTIESAHFVVHYYEPLDDVAHRVAVVAERAHRNLSPELGRVPETKTEIVIIDDTDGANGFASVLPRNRITLHATAPIGESALNDHDDWLYGLVSHEYTHILHLDSIGGLARWVNKVLGKTWAPNQIQPRWIIEGLATYEESRHSSSGRTRSTTFDMYLRVPVLDGLDSRIDEVSAGPYTFPRGNAAYLYGSKFLQYVFDRYGDAKLREMTWRAGSATIPYGINRQIEATVGKPFTELWDDWRLWLRDKYTVQLEAVERRGRRDGRRLTFTAEGNISPQYTLDGKELVWLANDGASHIRLRAIPVGGNVGDARDVLPLDRVGGWAMLSDGSVVYEQTQVYRRDYDFQDLMYWDAPTRTTTRLTTGLRARDPAVSPDGRQVAFSINGGSHSTLAVMPLVAGGTPRVVYEGDRFDQVFQPAWSPDGGKLAFSAWRAGGFKDILVLDLASGEVTELAHDRALDGDPTWGPDGRLVFFASDRTGIADIYAHDLETGALWQVTDVVGGAFDPAVSPDGTRLAYHGFVTGGYDLFEIDLDPARWTPAVPYLDDRPPPVEVPDDEAAVTAPRPYRAIETLGPESWSAQYAAGTAIGNALTIRTGGSDVAGLHGWSLAASISLDDGVVNVGGAYSYGGLRLPVRISAGRSLAHRSGWRIDGVSQPYDEETLSTTLSVGLPTRRSPDSSLSMSLDLDADRYRIVDGPDATPDPGALVPRPPTSNYLQTGVALRASWSNVRGYAQVLGPTEGREASASLRYDDPALGARFRNLALNWSARAYWKLWGETPVLTARYAGGVRVTDVDRGSAYGLGGVPDQDVANAIIQSQRASNTGYLRGYESRVVDGDKYHLLNVEYRQRLWQIERGPATNPIYVRRLHVAGFLDAGTAYDGPLRDAALKYSVGAALRCDAVFGYYVPGSFELGYARGLADEGINETWLLLTTTF